MIFIPFGSDFFVSSNLFAAQGQIECFLRSVLPPSLINIGGGVKLKVKFTLEQAAKPRGGIEK
jgi:hypothetical protein